MLLSTRRTQRLPSPLPPPKRAEPRDRGEREFDRDRDRDRDRERERDLRMPPPIAPALSPNEAVALNVREMELLALLADNVDIGPDPTAYWNSDSLPLAAPPCGLVSATLYTQHQRIGLLQFTLFNRIISEQRTRFFARRTGHNNLWFKIGEPATYTPDHLLPFQAAQGQVFDLIPATAFHGEQMGTRCQRPDSAITAAAANKVRREAELLKETQRAIQKASAQPTTVAAQTQALPQTPAQILPSPTVLKARNAFSDFLERNMREQEKYYVQNPRRFQDDEAGEKVHLGSSSKADNPAPGRNFGSIGTPSPTKSSTEASPTSSHSTLEELRTPVDDPFDPFPGIDGRDPRLIALLTNTPDKERHPDWICACGTLNYGSRVNCLRLECGNTRPRAPEPVQSRSALGDPGDWYCDHCGLCNWTRRAFCMRCCPLHPDNIEEAITKGLVHFDDPIIVLLGYTEKRARAMRKMTGKGAPSYCACFGPHHGTRCPYVGRGVPDEIWKGYNMSTEELIAAMPAPPTPPARTVRNHFAAQAAAQPHGHGHHGEGHGTHARRGRR